MLLELPFRLAMLDMDAAAKPMVANPGVTAWAVGGHSLGGVAAASFAGKNDATVQGLVLLASYLSVDLSQSSVQVVSITATEDKVLNWGSYNDTVTKLPTEAEYVSIEGGNHGQFGMYGQQSGDGVAVIASEAQQTQAMAATRNLLKTL